MIEELTDSSYATNLYSDIGDEYIYTELTPVVDTNENTVSSDGSNVHKDNPYHSSSIETSSETSERMSLKEGYLTGSYEKVLNNTYSKDQETEHCIKKCDASADTKTIVIHLNVMETNKKDTGKIVCSSPKKNEISSQEPSLEVLKNENNDSDQEEEVSSKDNVQKIVIYVKT